MMIFPVLLLTAGMALVIPSITLEIMVGGATVGLSHPLRVLLYNMTITAASVIVALAIGGLGGAGVD